ncbi:MAG: WhiB family transcriptional regulator [Acidimicrobiales bacterium]|jgi:WhiB family redox-sensing transcriptional regulator|nr:WhiB family transcriptional regulator [Acidimicrobiales bacterium]|tara:strand:- start:1060 stop:1299 length:240 start_codon:yes stop_codon:yes gene_type:complete
MNTKWMSKGNCADTNPDAFFPSDGVGVEIAKSICNRCPVASLCLDYALTYKINHGVWGGCSERQRRRIRKERRELLPAA